MQAATNSESSFQPLDLHQEVKQLEQKVNQEPSNSNLMQYAEALIKSEDFPGALKILHQILDESDGKDPILFHVYKNMGNIYLKCGDIDAAEEKYNLANAIDSDDENLVINYGVLAIQRGQYDEAKKRFSSVLHQNISSDLAWVGLALVHRAYSDQDLARACLLRGLDENPYNKLAIINYFQWCQQDGIDATTEIVDTFVEKFPKDQEINSLLQGINN